MAESLTTPQNIHIRFEDSMADVAHEIGSDSGLQAEVLEMIMAQRRSQRELILDEVPSDTEGLDLASIDSFFDRYGLRKVTHIEVAEAKYDDLIGAGLGADLFGSEVVEESAGFYVQAVELAFTNRNEELERRNGKGYTESIIVHEMAHGSAKPDDYMFRLTPELSKPGPARLGHIALGDSKVRGNFVEEGWAEVVRARYMREALGMSDGFAPTGVEIDTIETVDGVSLPIHSIYRVHKMTDEGSDNEYEAGYLHTSYAGAAMDFMISQDPGLWDALLSARHGVEGLREVARRIDAFQSGLYMELNRLQYTEGDFERGLGVVVSALDVPIPSPDNTRG